MASARPTDNANEKRRESPLRQRNTDTDSEPVAPTSTPAPAASEAKEKADDGLPFASFPELEPINASASEDRHEDREPEGRPGLFAGLNDNRRNGFPGIEDAYDVRHAIFSELLGGRLNRRAENHERAQRFEQHEMPQISIALSPTIFANQDQRMRYSQIGVLLGLLYAWHSLQQGNYGQVCVGTLLAIASVYWDRWQTPAVKPANAMPQEQPPVNNRPGCPFHRQ